MNLTSRSQITSLSDIITILNEWESKFFDPGSGSIPIWYRGQANIDWEVQPTVLRDSFQTFLNSKEIQMGSPLQRSVQAERTINNEFRRNSASLISSNATLTELYFLAQHHGMPTRLLDWSINPLVALFFACNSHHDSMLLFIFSLRELYFLWMHLTPNDIRLILYQCTIQL